MQSKRYSLIFFAVLVFFAVINFVVSFNSYSSEKYFKYGNKIYSSEMIKKSDKYLETLNPEEYDAEYLKLDAEHKELEKFLHAKEMLSDKSKRYLYRSEFTEDEAKEIVEKAGMSETEAENRMTFINLCCTQLRYASGYSDYVSDVLKNTGEMKNSGLFDEDKQNKIIHTGSQYYLLENVKVSAVSDAGIKMLFSDRISDVFALLAAFLSAFVFSLYLKSGSDETVFRKTGFIRYVVALTVFAVGIYTLNAVAADHAAGLGNLSRAVQSLRDFKLCSLTVSTGEFLVLRIIVKATAAMIVFLVSVACFLAERKIIAVGTTVILFAEELLRSHLGSRVSCFAFWNPESVISEYSSVKVFGEYVNTYIIFLAADLICFIACLLVSNNLVNKTVEKYAEKAEKAYLDEVNLRYNESRLIRHDIKNHLSAIAGLLDAGDTTGALKYIGEISDEIENVKPPVKTGSGVLDAILYKKYSAASENKIKIYTEFASDFSGYRFSDYDLCGIFSNILDNAFEACSALEESERIVTLSVREQMNMICITCENPYADLKKDGDGFATLKSDRKNHGLGLKRISGIAKKYGGSTDISTEDGIFTVSVLLMK